jgi:hypothetical protein
MRAWQNSPDLAGVRPRDPSEAMEWRAFWAEVEKACARAFAE